MGVKIQLYMPKSHLRVDIVFQNNVGNIIIIIIITIIIIIIIIITIIVFIQSKDKNTYPKLQ